MATDAIERASESRAKVYSVRELAAIARGQSPLHIGRLAATLSVLVAIAEQQPDLLASTLTHLRPERTRRPF